MTVIKQGKVSDALRLCDMLLRKSNDATDYRVDVIMDRLGHISRTKLADTEFGNGLVGAVTYALANSSSRQYTIIRDAGKRYNGADYVYYTIVLN